MVRIVFIAHHCPVVIWFYLFFSRATISIYIGNCRPTMCTSASQTTVSHNVRGWSCSTCSESCKVQYRTKRQRTKSNESSPRPAPAWQLWQEVSDDRVCSLTTSSSTSSTTSSSVTDWQEKSVYETDRRSIWTGRSTCHCSAAGRNY